MSDEFNMSMRKFLKQVGVTSQQEIEKAIRAAKPGGKVRAKMVLTIDEVGLEHVVEGDIEGGHVGFDKRYEGTHKVTAWIEEGEEAQFEIESHLVRYEGELDEGGARLRGTWRIRCGDEDDEAAGDGDDDASGAFELLRQ